MTTRRLRHLLYGSAAGLTLATVGVVAWTLYGRPRDGLDAADLRAHTSEQLASMTPATPTLPRRDALIALAQQPLRQQLFDPPPPPPEDPPPPPPLPGVELISTVLPSSGDPSAWVRDPAQGNTPRKIRIGDVLGPEDNPATVTAIEPGRLLVEHNGETKPIHQTDPSAGGRR